MLDYFMSSQTRFVLNQTEYVLPETCSNTTLLEYLRQEGLVGTKEGCGDGDCGACTVVMLGQSARGKPQFQAMNSCLIPLGAVAGKELFTVEGIAKEGLHPVQESMIQTGGSQCGYCTPGFIMSMFAAYYSGERTDLAVEGNLCRCTGYLPIREALRSLAEPGQNDIFLQILENSETRKANENTRDFHQPSSLKEVFDLLGAYPEATFIAGGTDLGLDISNKARAFSRFISLEHVSELKIIKDEPATLEIGAGIPLSHIESVLHGIFPALDEMIHWFAARQIRNRATIGGNLGTASPIGDLPPVLLALDASIKLASSAGERIIPLADYFLGYRQTARQKGEVIVSVIIPKAQTAQTRQSFAYKVGKRGTDDISIVAAAFSLDTDEHGQITHARLAYGGVAATPVRALEVETWLLGKVWNQTTVNEAKKRLLTAFSPLSDFRGSAHYRQRLIANLFEKFYWQVAEVTA